MTTTRFCFIRHGETDWNVARRIQGQQDVPLNATGRQQAQALARALQAESCAALYASDLARAWATALPIAAALACAPQPLAGLRERHYGVLEGLTAGEAQARYPQAHAAQSLRALAHDLGGGETLSDFAARVTACCYELAARHSGQALILVTHGGVLDIVYRLASGRDLSGARDFPAPNGGINRLDFHDGKFHFVAWGETTHLTRTEAALEEVSA